MKLRPYIFGLVVLIALFGAVIIALLPPANPRQSVVLRVITNYVAQSSNLTSFSVSNIGPRAILLTDLIVETNGPKGWQGFSHTVPTHPQRLDTSEAKDFTLGAPVEMENWRLRLTYGTDVKGPMLQWAKAEYAITHLRFTGPGFGVMAGNTALISPEFSNSSSASLGCPEILGSGKFSNQVYQAIQLLRARDLEAYIIVTNHVGRIQEGERSGMWAFRVPPTYEMSDITALYSVTWCAATIAHDSFHSKLYHDYLRDHSGPVPDAVWTGISAEQQCMKFQLVVMEHIGAPVMEVTHAKQQADGRYVKDRETWQDYQQRKW
jgi:hypothetical protein